MLHAKAFDEGRRVVVVDAVPGDDRDLDHVLAEIDAALAMSERQGHRNTGVDYFARNDADRLRRRPLPPRCEIGRLDPPRLNTFASARPKHRATADPRVA